MKTKIIYTTVIGILIISAFIFFIIHNRHDNRKHQSSLLTADSSITNILSDSSSEKDYTKIITQLRKKIKTAEFSDSLTVDSIKKLIATLETKRFYLPSVHKNIILKIKKIQDNSPLKIEIELINNSSTEYNITEDNFMVISKIREKIKPDKKWNKNFIPKDTLLNQFEFQLQEKDLSSFIFFIPELNLKFEKKYQ